MEKVERYQNCVGNARCALPPTGRPEIPAFQAMTLASDTMRKKCGSEKMQTATKLLEAFLYKRQFVCITFSSQCPQTTVLKIALLLQQASCLVGYSRRDSLGHTYTKAKIPSNKRNTY